MNQQVSVYQIFIVCQSEFILTEILSLVKNYIDRVIYLAENNFERDISLTKNVIYREGKCNPTPTQITSAAADISFL